MKTRKGWTKWTKEEISEVYRLINCGFHIDEIAESMANRTESSVSNRIYTDKRLFDLYQSCRPKRSYRRGVRIKEAPMEPIHTEPENAENTTKTLTLSVCDISSTIAAMCSFSTMVIVLLAVFAG
jgi:hypothetical protein|tara:strand:- start:214 stop:588 length:375 start_codon:yes stop_codon:yes gene_type:complete